MKKTNIVYLITFLKRKLELNFPYYYLGIKHECSLENNKILDKYGKSYYGSSKYKSYKSIVKENLNDLKIEILFSSDNKEECAKQEQLLQLHYNVVLSPEYFNQSISNGNNKFFDPTLISVKNILSNKICRLPKDHPEVISGLWIGVSKGKKWYNNGIISKTFDKCPEGWIPGRLIDMRGEKNNFYGKKHKKENLEKGVKKRMDNKSYVAWNKGIKKNK
jgi:hypothetical protein